MSVRSRLGRASLLGFRLLRVWLSSLSIDQPGAGSGLARSNYIKIDVPGSTKAIIVGEMRTLQRPEFRWLRIEMRGSYHVPTAGACWSKTGL